MASATWTTNAAEYGSPAPGAIAGSPSAEGQIPPQDRRAWIVNRYFGRFHPTRQDRWLFGDRDTGACLTRLSWTPIRRHQQVKADASPDDPALASYWQQRRRRRMPPDTPTAPAPAPYTLRRPQGLA